MRKAISLAAIREGKILLVKKKNVWILPGGKPKPGESDDECLAREISEELPGITIKNTRFYGEFYGRTPHKGDILLAGVYLGDCEGEIYPAAEITASCWAKHFGHYQISDITQKIISSLLEDGYL